MLFPMIIIAGIYFFLIAFLASGLQRLEHSQTSMHSPYISIIVAAKNEEQHIANCLKHLQNQNISQTIYEIIVVDDHSTDDTANIAKQFNVQLVKTRQDNYVSSKKNALECGIRHAKGEIILLTDADCSPPPGWAQSMTQCFEKNTALVAGFSPQIHAPHFWNRYLYIDSQSAAIVSASTIAWGRGVTCTGRNLAFRNHLFVEMGGFADTQDTLSGDDDFILQKFSKLSQWNVAYNISPDSIVPAVGPAGIQAFIQQKSRHLSSGARYPLGSQLVYAFANVATFLIPLFAISEIILKTINLLPLFIFLVSEYWLFLIFSKKFNIITISFFDDFAWRILSLTLYAVAAIKALIWGPTWKEKKPA